MMLSCCATIAAAFSVEVLNVGKAYRMRAVCDAGLAVFQVLGMLKRACFPVSCTVFAMLPEHLLVELACESVSLCLCVL